MKNIKLLIADDDEIVRSTLAKLINTTFSEINIKTVSNGQKAWDYILEAHPQIILCDIFMPGMDGFSLLDKIRSVDKLNDLYFIMLTAHTDSDKIKKALSAGADDFINKPVVFDILRSRIKSALRIIKMQMKLQEENNLLMDLADELEQDIQDMTMLSLKFMQARIPNSFQIQKKVAEAAVWIAKQYGGFKKDRLRDIEIAAFLSQTGRFFLPDSMIEKKVMENGRPTDKIMQQVPASGKNIISSVSRFQKVANIIYHIYENLDGSGFPERLQSWQIPFESRIIRVALDYEEERMMYDKEPDSILNSMMDQIKRIYDHRVVVLMDHFVKSESQELYNPNEKPVKLSDLEPGMEITRDLITDKGLKLVPAGFVLKENTINIMISHNSNDPILGDIYVKK